MIKKGKIIIFILIILVIIGIIYQYFRKQNEGFNESINSIDIEQKYVFTNPPLPSDGKTNIPYNELYSEVMYKDGLAAGSTDLPDQVFRKNVALSTRSFGAVLTSNDFKLDLIDNITVYPATRETYINKNQESWQNFKIKHRTQISFQNNSDPTNINSTVTPKDVVTGYFEITFQSCTGADPFFKLVYNGESASNNKITIINNLPDSQFKNIIRTDSKTLLNNIVEYPQPNIISKNNLNALNQLNLAVKNGLGSNIIFDVVCIKKDGVIYDQFSLTIKNTKVTFQLPNDKLNHFYTGIRTLDIFLKDKTNDSYTSFDLITSISKQMFLQYEPSRLVVKRSTAPPELIHRGLRTADFYKPRILIEDQKDWLMLGFYIEIGSIYGQTYKLCTTRPECYPLLIKKDPKYVIPAETGTFAWDNNRRGRILYDAGRDTTRYLHHITNSVIQNKTYSKNKLIKTLKNPRQDTIFLQ
jgi:hypothetical protein